MTAQQLSMFDLLEPSDPLAGALRRGTYEGYRLRAFAALTYPAFQQYADRWLCRELSGTGGYAGWMGGGCHHDFSPSGIRIRDYRHGTEQRYTWPAAVRRLRQLIEEPDWLSREDERLVDHLMLEAGRLPYPRACCRYPEDAWGEPPEKALI